MSLLDLPTELVIQILASGPWRAILSSCRVCKHLKAIIDDSLLLQYTIELGAGGYVDGPSNQPNSLSLEERYRKVVALEEGWLTLSFPVTQSKTFTYQSSIYELYGGVYIRGRNGDSLLHLTRFPSPLSQTPGQSWSLLVDHQCRDIGMDPGQDLLVSIGRKQGTTWEIFLRTLSSGSLHSEAQSPSLVWTTDHRGSVSFTINVVEDQLAVMFSSPYNPYDQFEPPTGDLVVWNWKTGKLRTALHGPFNNSGISSFLSKNTIMVAELERRHSSFEDPKDTRPHFRASLVVYVIPESPSSDADRQVQCQKVAAFHFPLFKSEVRAISISSRSDPSPVAQRWPSGRDSSATTFKPFSVDPLKRIIVVSLDIEYLKKGLLAETLRYSEYTVFVHSEVFTSALGEERILSGEGFDAGTMEFEWKAWQRFARFTTLQRYGNYVCFVYGQRYIDYEQLQSRIHLWDFNQSVLRPTRILSKPPSSDSSPSSSPITENQVPYLEQNHRGIALTTKSAGLDEVRAGVSAMNRFALYPVIETGTSVIKNKEVFVYRKVKSSLPFRRTTKSGKVPPLAGVMLDDERIYMLERLSNGVGSRMWVKSMEAVGDLSWCKLGSEISS